LPRDVGVIIVAAGQGVRLGGTVPKQYRELGGVPMLLRALRPFTAHPEVAHTVVALPAHDAATPPAWLATLLGGTLTVVSGGAARSDSVAHGLDALPPACTTVLVHDAARPLVDRATIDRVITAARLGHGAVPGIRLEDTLKDAAEPGLRVQRTVPRDRLWRAQTPQGFPRHLLADAHARARREEAQATDDAGLVERLGAEVRMVPGSVFNLKVTTEEDLRIAERLL
jgi:2-C-methyl-D-erythritol 4-phosphate cytidylyltransferase